MKIRGIIAVLAVCFCGRLIGQDNGGGGSSGPKPPAKETVLYSGKYYREATVIRVSEVGAEIRSRDGNALIPLNALPPGLKAAADRIFASQQEQAAGKEQAPGKHEPPTISGLVIQKVPEGLLIANADSRTILLRGYPDESKVVNRDSIRVFAREDGTFQYQAVAGVAYAIRAFAFTAAYK